MEEVIRRGLQKFYVIVKFPVHVTKVDSEEGACNVAIAKVSKLLPHYVDLDVATRICEECGSEEREVLLVGDEAIVAVLAGAKVSAKDEKGAERVMKSIVGRATRSEIVTVSVNSLTPH